VHRIALALVIALLAEPGSKASAQRLPVPSLRLAAGFGVDTTSSAAREVFDLWRRYLGTASDSARARLWSPSERALWQSHYDLLAGYVYQGFPNLTVIRLLPAVGLPDTYLITTLVSSVDDSTHVVKPLAMFRVYATIEGGRWVLANALPRMTREWRRETIGAITFLSPPTRNFNRRRAQSSAAFVDSLSHAFGLPPPQPISYYFTSDLSETLRALGLEFYPLGSDTVGGRSNVGVRHVYVGSSTNGEGYRHELAHIILAPEVGRQTFPLLAEGLMTWAGGSAGLDYHELLPGLARYLAANPYMTLEEVMERPPLRVGSLDVGYSGLAVLCDLVFRAKGLQGLRAILQAGTTPAEVLDSAAHQLALSRASLGSLWRTTIQKR
jgi:hypothetical protein